MNRNATYIGLDIAKTVFYVVGKDDAGREVLKRKLKRDQVLDFFANLPPAKVGIEACGGAHYWAREINRLGHEAKLIAGQHAKKYVSGNKNDYRDAQGICEARSRADMRYVPINTETQQELQMLHRIRQQVMTQRIALICQTRSFLGEFGLVLPEGVKAFYRGIQQVLGENPVNLAAGVLEMVLELKQQLDRLEDLLARYDARIEQAAQRDERSKRLMAVPSIGPMIATSLIAAVHDPRHFKSGRGFAANLGLTPHEHSSGGRQVLLGISKRGDRYFRTLLIHGARSALRTAEGKTDRMLVWALKLKQAKGFNVAAVALANKVARIAWALLAHDRQYQAQ
jgi:transposase